MDESGGAFNPQTSPNGPASAYGSGSGSSSSQPAMQLWIKSSLGSSDR